MARIYPFRAYRFSEKAGKLDDLVTQPYDKITEPMRQQYLARSPYNIVRIILGERFPTDTDTNNVYTRAATYLETWVREGILQQDPQPAIYPYVQRFQWPETGEQLARVGFVALGAVEDYSAGTVFRHEKTLSGPKADRLQLLRATKAHFGQIFMLYPDPQNEVESLIARFIENHPPIARVIDDYGVENTVWQLAEPVLIEQIQQLMASKPLMIADGHHRYETALAYFRENPSLPGADKVMMTFVSTASSGLRILPTHRTIAGLIGFQPDQFLRRISQWFSLSRLENLQQLRQVWQVREPEKVRVGIVLKQPPEIHLAERPRQPGELDTAVVHDLLIHQGLGITESVVREGRFLGFVRGLEEAVQQVEQGDAELALLLEPPSVEQVTALAFAGKVLPQKSTDFYPKLLSGLLIYRLGEE